MREVYQWAEGKKREAEGRHCLFGLIILPYPSSFFPSLRDKIARMPRATWLALALLLLGFGLRLIYLDYTPIWWDEGWGVVLGRMPLAQSLQATASDEHPPLYYWTLHFWQLVAGETPFAVRYPSVLAATLTCAALFQVGRRLGGARLGALAVLFLTLQRLHLMWSQEVKMYASATLFTLLSFSFLLEWWSAPRPRWRTTLAYVVMALLAIFSHYIALLIIVAQGIGGVWWGLAEWRTNKTKLVAWLGVQALINVFLVPWMLYLIYGVGHQTFAAFPPLSPDFFLLLLTATLTIGLSVNLSAFTAHMLAFLLGSAAWWPLLWRGAPRQVWASRIIALNLFFPTLLVYGLSLIPVAQLYSPKFDSRYLLLLVPFAMLAVAWGLERWRARWPRVAYALAVAILVAQFNLLPGYFLGRLPVADYPAVMRALFNQARPEDGVIAYTDLDWPVLEYYNHARLKWYGIPSRATLTPEEVASRIDPRAQAHPALWVIVSPDALRLDPARAILQQVATHYPLQSDQIYGRYRLQLYAPEPRTTLPQPVEPFTRLAWNSLIGYDRFVPQVSPGDFFPVNLYWERTAQTPDAWRLQLVDSAGGVKREVTGTVPAGVVFSSAALPVSAAWPSGDYQVRLQLADATRALFDVRLFNHHTTAAPPENVAHPLQIGFDDLAQLIGLEGYPDQLHPSEALPLTLYWRVQNETAINYTVFIHLLGEEYNLATNNFVWGQVDREPLNGERSTSSWVAGETLADSYQVPLSADAPPGIYQIEIGLYDASTGERLLTTTGVDHVIVGTVQVP